VTAITAWLVIAASSPASARYLAYVTLPATGMVAVIDVVSERHIGSLVVGDDPETLAASPDGRMVFVANHNSSSLAVIATQHMVVADVLRFAPNDGPFLPHALDVSSDGRRLQVGLDYQDGCPFETTLLTIDLTTGARSYSGTQLGETVIEHVLHDDYGTLFAATAGGCGDYFYHAGIAVAGPGNPVWFVGELFLAQGPAPLAIGGIGIAQPNALYAALPNAHAVARVDLESLRRFDAAVAWIAVGQEPNALAVFPAGDRLLVANRCGADPTCAGPGSVSIVDTAAGLVSDEIPVGAAPVDVALTANGDRAVVANAGSRDLSILDLRSGRVRATIGLGTTPSHVVITNVLPEPTDCQQCSNAGIPSVDDLVRAMLVALGERPTFTCLGLDLDGSGGIDIADLVGATRIALQGCSNN
jgi:DNA-binding beta-propeller fold protein YncE